MKIKLLSVIVSFLLLSIGISSCLDSDETYEFSTDATVHAFGLDTIYGKHYTFTIDQLNRLIYNRDSLPVGADNGLSLPLGDPQLLPAEGTDPQRFLLPAFGRCLYL